MSPNREPSRDAAPILRATSRRRLAILLCATAFGYAILCAFWSYLSTGEWLRVWPAHFAADFTGPVTLPDVFERTLNVLSHPSMILVGGLVLGTLILAPILVAALDRTWTALIMAPMIWALAHAPAMAVAVAIGCSLAGQTHLRRTAPMLAAILGAVPAGIYLYFFSSAGSGWAAVLPIQRWALKAPYLAAALVAMAGFALVLNLARATRYRAGLVLPILAALTALPLGIFSWTIGRAELEYQLIAGPLAAGDAIFEPADLASWTAGAGGGGISPQAIPQRAAADLEERKTELRDRCRRFLRRFPHSPRAPAVLWVLAQCQSLQLDRPALAQGWVKSSAAHSAPVPNEEELSPPRRAEQVRETIQSATKIWEAMLRDYPRSPQAAVASWRLAELDLRGLAAAGSSTAEAGASARAGGGAPAWAGDANVVIRRARERLQAAQASLQSREADAGRELAAQGDTVFARAPSVPSRAYCRQVLMRVRRLLWIMERNGIATNPRAAEALGAMLQVNDIGQGPRATAQELYDLAGQYEDTPLAMNLKLAVALAETDCRRRAEQLAMLAEDEHDADTAVEAAYELGLLLLQYPNLCGMPDMNGPADWFRLARDAGESPWAPLAAERLRYLEIAPQR
jgi:hypothetical protein